MDEPTPALRRALVVWEALVGAGVVAVLAGAAPRPDLSLAATKVVFRGETTEYLLSPRPDYDGLIVQSRSGGLPVWLNVTDTTVEWFLGVPNGAPGAQRGSLLAVSIFSPDQAGGIQVYGRNARIPTSLIVGGADVDGEGRGAAMDLGDGPAGMGGVRFDLEEVPQGGSLVLARRAHQTHIHASPTGSVQVLSAPSPPGASNTRSPP